MKADNTISLTIPVNHANEHFRALDGIRGLAAVAVVLYHMKWATGLQSFAIISHGGLAVDLFFVISGFVIASTYLDRLQTSVQLRNFVLLRLFRLVPLH